MAVNARMLRAMDEAAEPTAVVGVTTARAAALVDISVAKLATWERIGLVIPESTHIVAGRHLRVFSLGDLVELSVASQLERSGVQVRVIRRLVEAHRNHTSERPLRELRWATSNGQVYVGFDDGTWVGGRAPMQGVLPEVIDLEQIRSRIGRQLKVRPEAKSGELVEKRDRTLGRKAVFAGTRTPVEAVIVYLRRGIADAEIFEAFPHLTERDLVAARELHPA